MNLRVEAFVRLVRTEPVLCAAAVQAFVAIAAGLGLSASRPGRSKQPPLRSSAWSWPGTSARYPSRRSRVRSPQW